MNTETIAECQVREQIYESANSLVYRGTRLADGQPVILKVLKEDYPTPAELKRYRQEFAIAQCLQHTGIVKAYSQQPFKHTLAIVLEDFGGESLSFLLKNSILSLEAFFPIAIAVADALAYIHQQHVIHKDINPSNIVLNPNTGTVKIVDFGIATQLNRENPSLKHPNVLEGTLAYLSPEQTGRMNRALDYRTDFYSLGVTFYELLAGQLPFAIDDPLAIVHAHIAKHPIPPHHIRPEIPDGLSNLVMKLMAKTAEERYQSGEGIKADLQHCFQQFQNVGLVPTFPLAGQDFSDRFQVPQKLYGREAEIAMLLAAFHRISQGESRSEWMLVAGYSGIGKSSLVAEIHKPITEKRGYFIAGKFDQYQRSVPYSAVVSAFQDLMEQLLTEDEAQLQSWRERLLAALGNNAQVIIDVIPAVELILGPQPPLPQLRPTEAQNRFNLVFQRFLRVFCAREHPLVIFLDDLQWADSGSLKLIELMMTDRDIQGLLPIGAYRNNEVQPTHPLMLLRDFLQDSGAAILEITLQPLSQNYLSLMIADTLHRPLDRVASLAELVLQKTEGNPFFVNEFLKSLYAEQLLTFDPELRIWKWDLGQIRARNITDNVVELLIHQLKKFSPATQKRLQLAACLGAYFDLSSLAIISETPAQEVFQDLKVAIQQGLILTLSELNEHLTIESYRFGHDRIQQAAYALIAPEARPSVHLKTGQLLWRGMEPATIAERIFEVIDHLNQGTALIAAQATRDEVARLNLQAGRKARSATAYGAALRYFDTGLELLGKGGWERDYDLTLALHEEAIEVAYLNGEFALQEELSQRLLQQARTTLDTVKMYRIRILAASGQNKHLEATDIGFDMLERLGIHFDAFTDARMQRELKRTQQLHQEMEIPELVNLPEMQHPEKLAAMNILSDILSSGYQSAFDRFILCNLKQIHLSLEFGNTEASAFAYDCYGIILCGVVGDMDAGHQFGCLALEVLDKLHSRQTRSRVLFVFNAFVRHWKEPLSATILSLSDAYQVGLETGDLEYACYALCWQSMHGLLVGQELPQLSDRMADFGNTIAELKQEACLIYMRIYQQVVANLRAENANPTILDGVHLQEQLFLTERSGNKLALAFFYTFKCYLCYSFAAYAEALESAKQALQYLDGMTAAATVGLLNFYHSLTLLALYEPASAFEQAKILEQVKENQRQLGHWAKCAPANHQHRYVLVEAEQYRVRDNYKKAADRYDRAIELAREQGYLHEEALAGELAARFYIHNRRPQYARVYLQDAYYNYQRWGAVAKPIDLEPQQTFGQTRSSQSTLTTTTSNRPSVLDLTAVLRASQAIAQEIVFDKLLSSLLRILVTSAGAQSGSLLLESKIDSKLELCIEASLDTQTDRETLLQSLPIQGKLPISVVNYVARSREPVVLDCAYDRGNFVRDPYIVTHETRSILCAPLLNQGGLSGIVYLENNLAANAFTADRVEILQLLSGQAAIAIDNARLYAEMERRVNDRTRSLSQAMDELRATQNELIQSEKMSALGQLIAGIAHEINTPMGAIGASIDNIFIAMEQSLRDLPQIFQVLDTETLSCFLALLEELKQPSLVLSTREERQLRRAIAATLETHGLENASNMAATLIQLGVTDDLERYLPLWRSTHCELVLRTARNLAVQRSNGENIRLAVEKASKIVFALKSYARKDNFDRPVIASIRQTIEVVLTIYHNLLKQGIQPICEWEELPLVACYPDALGQVWTNLIHNAIQAMDGQGTLAIKLVRQEDCAVVTISDTGCGIPLEKQAQIFQPFFTTKKAGEGSGLGLHIARQIVERHDGTLDFTSEPGHTTFRVTLPMKFTLEEWTD